MSKPMRKYAVTSEIGQQLAAILPPERIKTRAIDRYAFASDASFYYLVPKAVVQPVNVAEVQALFQFARTHGVSLTFRAGGTSLSGQSVTDGILVDLSQRWRGVWPENDGQSVRVQPGAIGSMVNIALKKYRRKIGPDPSSITAAMMGGILSNNSSGMCCGVVNNSYHTLQHLQLVLPNGLAFDTETPADYERFAQEAAPIYRGIAQLRARLLANEALTRKIREKYQMKNTVGYGLNAFLDYTHPLDILAHLLIGGEGTLGFIAEAVMRTVPDFPHKVTGMLYFSDVLAACRAIPALAASGAEALELMDRPALKGLEDLYYAPPELKALTGDQTALLVEYQANTAQELAEKFAKANEGCLTNLPLVWPAQFSTDATEQAKLWKLRKGAYPSVAAVRQKGTAVLLEDVAFPVPVLGEAILALRELFKKYRYDSANIIGHAKDGNLHFILTQSVNEVEEVARYGQFMAEMVELVVNKYDGALKGEHGTGRNMAPFVEAEWGGEAYAIMRELKQLIDPDNLLNPGVIINMDRQAHLKHLKALPIVEAEVDKCVECGYCENRCPSRDFTLSPRQRIVIRRALARLQQENKMAEYREVVEDYTFAGLETCAVDGLCAIDCPVDINTGELVKRLRRENHSPSAQKNALRVAKNFRLAENLVRFSLGSGHGLNRVFGPRFMPRFTSALQTVAGDLPGWNGQLGQPLDWAATRRLASQLATTLPPVTTEIVYFATCLTRMMGTPALGSGSVVESLLRVSAKAGITVHLPTDLPGHCCGQAFSSKGFADAFAYSVNQTVARLWEWTRQGKLPVVLDVTSCTQTLLHARPHLSAENQGYWDKMQFMDSIDYAADVLLPRLQIHQPKNRVVFHPVCSVHKMGLLKKLESLGQACAKELVVPQSAGCCGMAGDRGFHYPGLTQAATAAEATEVKEGKYDGYYSSARTCEMALSEAVGENYRSILALLDEVSRPLSQ
jgi:D-lactate dehydrogenase